MAERMHAAGEIKGRFVGSGKDHSGRANRGTYYPSAYDAHACSPSRLITGSGYNW
jgi:hypothetical protein